MEVTRRGFLKLTAAGVSSASLLKLSFPARASAQGSVPLRTKNGRETPTICAYCSVGCGLIATSVDGELVDLSGDPDHPINRGALCAKGSSLFGVRHVYAARTAKTGETNTSTLNPRRLTKVLYRGPGGAEWQERSWDWAMTEIAKRVQVTRDATFIERDYDGIIVNRTTGIASLGGAALDNEECYLIAKLNRALGVVYLEHQARL